MHVGGLLVGFKRIPGLMPPARLGAMRDTRRSQARPDTQLAIKNPSNEGRRAPTVAAAGSEQTGSNTTSPHDAAVDGSTQLAKQKGTRDKRYLSFRSEHVSPRGSRDHGKQTMRTRVILVPRSPGLQCKESKPLEATAWCLSEQITQIDAYEPDRSQACSSDQPCSALRSESELELQEVQGGGGPNWPKKTTHMWPHDNESEIIVVQISCTVPLDPQLRQVQQGHNNISVAS